ncbi:hypothetical protein [Thermococcus pacificus]|uniref:hypothetical protein n=1 Tax=Thermococcus pacificus TaxID=71998 RepID=UPI001E5DEC78|nr:hypothetical protein [Thermococcus pacificus]
MEWKSLFIGLLIGALIAVPLGMAHSGGFDIAEKTDLRWGFGPMGGYGMHGGMMGYGMIDDEMYAQMQDYMVSGNFTEIHEEMEAEMEEHMVLTGKK